MENKKHEFKIWNEYFEPIIGFKKRFEIRKGEFQIGDLLVLNETIKETDEITGRFCTCLVSYICDYAQKDGYHVLGIEHVIH